MEWTRGPVIGRGSSAAVSLATTTAGHLFAVKSADVSCSASLQNEQFLISQLCSPFVVKCFGSDVTAEKDGSFYNVFLEFAAGGALSDRVREEGGSLDEGEIGFFAQQVLKGLNYLHRLGFVHCDIKGQNILIGGDGGVKIADFGCAKRTECGGGGGFSSPPTFAGTPAYMAPEVARGEEQSFPADVWALGCTVIEMATGSNPWPEMKDPASALYRVAYSGDVPEIPSWFSDAAKDFLSKCFARDAKERWTAAELLQHPFLESSEANHGGIAAKSTKKSPTSVMDQHFWDALEVSDSSPDPTENPSEEDSPANRIRGLIGEDGSSFDSEEDWLTVRGDGIEECSEIELPNVETDQLIYEEDSLSVLGIDGEEIETAVVEDEDSLFHSYWDEIRRIDVSVIFEYEYIGGDCDSDVDDSLLTFHRIVIKDFFDSDQLFAPIFLVFSPLSRSLWLNIFNVLFSKTQRYMLPCPF